MIGRTTWVKKPRQFHSLKWLIRGTARYWLTFLLQSWHSKECTRRPNLYLMLQNENHVEEECDAEEIEADIVSKKPRDDNAECFPHQDDDSRLTGNSDDEDEDDEDDDDDDDWEMQSDGDDYLDDAEDDVSTVSEATRFGLKIFFISMSSFAHFLTPNFFITSSISTCSSVSSTTPSLIGENLESFSLGECELKSASSQCIGGPLVRTTINPLRRSLFSHVPPFINFMHHNEVPEKTLPPEICKHLRWKLSNITPGKMANNVIQ